MEYALWRIKKRSLQPYKRVVLILVLMEYALWRLNVLINLKIKAVLILVLMEYALWRVA